MRIDSLAPILALPLLVAAGCNGGATANTDASPAPQVDMATGCTGQITGGFYGAFAECTTSISDSAQFELLRLVPTKYKGDALNMALLGAFIPGRIAVRTYKLAELGPDTQVTFTLQYQSQRWFAGKDMMGVPTGDVTLRIDTLPVRPMDGNTDWEDRSIHGQLKATLIHDPQSPGMDQPVTVEATF